MSRGRKPKPTKIKELAGNPGKRALNRREPVPVSVIPPYPAHLADNKVAKKEWDRVTAELHALGMIGNIDRAALAMYCSAWADYVEACEALEDEGPVSENSQGSPIRNPWMLIKKQAMDQVMRFSAEFGMTPSSRSRVKSDIPNEDDELEQMLFKNRNVKVTQ